MKTIQISQLRKILEEHELYQNSDAKSGFLAENLDEHYFSNKVLSGLNFSGISLKGAKFINCELTRADFMGADLENVDFTASKCTYAVFKNANLLNTNFTDAKIGGACFEDTDLKNAIFKNVRYKERVKKTREELVYAKVSNVIYSQVQQINIDFLEYIKSKNMEQARKVFIVHGHDNLIKEKTARTLEQLGLKPIILHEQADGGKTIIEKFENNAIDVGFAIILLTDDDEGKAKRELDYRKRARQNVIFEMGYFMGKLGRERVLLLLDKGVEKPGDLDGIVYTPIDEHDAWKTKLVKEMKSVGYSISADDL